MVKWRFTSQSIYAVILILVKLLVFQLVAVLDLLSSKRAAIILKQKGVQMHLVNNITLRISKFYIFQNLHHITLHNRCYRGS